MLKFFRALLRILALLLLLSVLASIPIVNLFVLGVLLQAMSDVASSGKLRRAFALSKVAGQILSMLLGLLLCLTPIWILADFASDALLVSPGSINRWIVLLIVVAILMTLHLSFVFANGARFVLFFRPIHNIRSVTRQMREGTWSRETGRQWRQIFDELRLGHHFWLGLRVFVATALWLAIPTLLFLAYSTPAQPGRLIPTLIGAVILIPLFAFLPMMQLRFAMTQKWSAFLDFRIPLQRYRSRPFLTTLALACLYFASVLLPLYLVLIKMRVPPHTGIWDLAFVFLVTVLPGKLFLAWLEHRAVTKPKPTTRRAWLWGLVLLGALTFYCYFIHLAQTISPYGRLQTIQHSSLLLPIPIDP